MEYKIVHFETQRVRYLQLLKSFEKRKFYNFGMVLVIKDRYLNTGPD